jgi:hypothetical protein
MTNIIMVMLPIYGIFLNNQFLQENLNENIITNSYNKYYT